MKNVSAIICVYNEENTIKDVIISVSNSPIINELIVVNDGSTDSTRKIVEEMSANMEITDIHFIENMGKGCAMAVGLENAKNEIIAFIDADLSHLNSEHLHHLIYPVIDKEVDMVLGRPSQTSIKYSEPIFKSFTGERALLRKDIMPIVEKMKNSRFGVETLINLYYQSENKRIKYVTLSGLMHPTKFDKTTTARAMKELILEGHQITRTAFKHFNLVRKSIKNQINKF